jgi:hypothetical protein
MMRTPQPAARLSALLRKLGAGWWSRDPTLLQPLTTHRPMGPRRHEAHRKRRQAALGLGQSPHVAGVQGVVNGRSGDACAFARQLALPRVQMASRRGEAVALAVFLARD